VRAELPSPPAGEKIEKAADADASTTVVSPFGNLSGRRITGSVREGRRPAKQKGRRRCWGRRETPHKRAWENRDRAWVWRTRLRSAAGRIMGS